MRNGNRWRVAAVNSTTNRIDAERLDDGARVVFDATYVREHGGLGYAVNVHFAQGVTADTSHAVLGENNSRALVYVAMTRGHHTNTAHLYQRSAGDQEYGQQKPDGTHVKYRGTSREAAALVYRIVTNHDQPAITAHDYAAQTPGAKLPERVRRLLDRQMKAVDRRRETYEASPEVQNYAHSMSRACQQAASRSRNRSSESGIEL